MLPGNIPIGEHIERLARTLGGVMAEDRSGVQRFFGCIQHCMGAIAVGGCRRFAYGLGSGQRRSAGQAGREAQGSVDLRRPLTGIDAQRPVAVLRGRKAGGSVPAERAAKDAGNQHPEDREVDQGHEPEGQRTECLHVHLQNTAVVKQKVSESEPSAASPERVRWVTFLGQP